jgi:hypothetical protein
MKKLIIPQVVLFIDEYEPPKKEAIEKLKTAWDNGYKNPDSSGFNKTTLSCSDENSDNIKS